MSQAQTIVADSVSIEKAASKPKTAAGRREGRSVNGTLITLIGLAILFTGWSVAVKYLAVPTYILPTPSAVWNALWSGIAVSPSSPLGYYLPLWGTLKNAALGLAIGSGLGLVLGSLMAESRLIEKLIMPYAFALQSLPKVAIAPLMIVWFGFGLSSKIFIVALTCLFPSLVNTLSLIHI